MLPPTSGLGPLSWVLGLFSSGGDALCRPPPGFSLCSFDLTNSRYAHQPLMKRGKLAKRVGLEMYHAYLYHMYYYYIMAMF
ncbi:hypothetical protein AB205_0017990 [Aquarana catesbeiana]|uniref:Uncharacterized protein n=1 Tax=Aquarana catesbeiana TaxID=8400 RepID=A0A2G9RX89_AQUCT|nr:hypothetical protein AB205_0017990 [Aquarana catesbeiana]